MAELRQPNDVTPQETRALSKLGERGLPLRVLTGSTLLLLLLPRSALACPTSWGRQPVIRREWGPHCYFVPAERSTSLFRCVDLCKEEGGSPACIGSAEENAFVATELATVRHGGVGGLWLGLYQNETGLGPTKGWDRCVDVGDAPSFTNWHDSQPDYYHGYQQDCAWFDAGTGRWRALACDGGVRFDPLPWRLAELSCLCDRGNASAAFADDRKALEATSVDNKLLLARRTAIAFSVALALALLPLFLLGRRGWHPLRRGARMRSVHTVRENGASTSSFIRSKTAAALSRLSDNASSAAVKGLLRAARASAAGRRLRVSFAMGQAGWALVVTSLTPAVMRASEQSIEAAVGNAERWLVPLPPGICLLALALFPIDARAIRVVCATILVVSTVMGTLNTLATLSGHRPAATGFPIAALLFTTAAALASTLRCRGDRALQPRPALRRLWAVGRLGYLGLGAIYAGSSIADYVQGGSNYDHSAYAAVSVAFLLCAALPTARNRSRLHRHLGRLGARGTVAEEAASVAALVGGSAPDATLERAAKLLRCLPASRLHAADLADKSAASSDGPTLHARTEPAAMGEVTAFLSHSWSDEDEAPGAKHALISRWASVRQEATGKEPTLWLVTLTHSHSSLCTLVYHVPCTRMYGEEIRAPRPLPHTQDKACIDQNNIKQSLACLPVFLAGCQTLLVVAGPTYCSRLWCVMELFTFARSKRL